MAMSRTIGSSGATGYDPVYGGKPAPLNVKDELQEALLAAISNFGNLSSLASKTNTFNQGQILDQLNEVIPGFTSLTGKATDAVSDRLSGLVPKDVQDAVQSSAAARAVGGGYGGSGMHSNLLARDLGLTSLGIQSEGLRDLSNLTSSVRSNATAPIFDVSKFFVSPSETLDVQRSNNQVAASPDPKARALWEQKLFEKYYNPAGTTQKFGSGPGAISSVSFPSTSPFRSGEPIDYYSFQNSLKDLPSGTPVQPSLPAPTPFTVPSFMPSPAPAFPTTIRGNFDSEFYSGTPTPNPALPVTGSTGFGNFDSEAAALATVPNDFWGLGSPLDLLPF